MYVASGIVGMALFLIAAILAVIWILAPLLILSRMKEILVEIKKSNEFANKTAWYSEQGARILEAKLRPVEQVTEVKD